MSIIDSHQSEHEELGKIFEVPRGTRTERMNNTERNYTLCLRYPQTKNSYIALTKHAFKKIICVWIGDLPD